MLPVDPATNKFLIIRSFTLSDFILMVRKDQVDTAGVNIGVVPPEADRL